MRYDAEIQLERLKGFIQNKEFTQAADLIFGGIRNEAMSVRDDERRAQLAEINATLIAHVNSLKPDELKQLFFAPAFRVLPSPFRSVSLLTKLIELPARQRWIVLGGMCDAIGRINLDDDPSGKPYRELAGDVLSLAAVNLFQFSVMQGKEKDIWEFHAKSDFVGMTDTDVSNSVRAARRVCNALMNAPRLTPIIDKNKMLDLPFYCSVEVAIALAGETELYNAIIRDSKPDLSYNHACISAYVFAKSRFSKICFDRLSFLTTLELMAEFRQWEFVLKHIMEGGITLNVLILAAHDLPEDKNDPQYETIEKIIDHFLSHCLLNSKRRDIDKDIRINAFLQGDEISKVLVPLVVKGELGLLKKLLDSGVSFCMADDREKTEKMIATLQEKYSKSTDALQREQYAGIISLLRSEIEKLIEQTVWSALANFRGLTSDFPEQDIRKAVINAVRKKYGTSDIADSTINVFLANFKDQWKAATRQVGQSDKLKNIKILAEEDVKSFSDELKKLLPSSAELDDRNKTLNHLVRILFSENKEKEFKSRPEEIVKDAAATVAFLAVTMMTGSTDAAKKNMINMTTLFVVKKLNQSCELNLANDAVSQYATDASSRAVALQKTPLASNDQSNQAMYRSIASTVACAVKRLDAGKTDFSHNGSAMFWAAEPVVLSVNKEVNSGVDLKILDRWVGAEVESEMKKPAF